MPPAKQCLLVETTPPSTISIEFELKALLECLDE